MPPETILIPRPRHLDIGGGRLDLRAGVVLEAAAGADTALRGLLQRFQQRFDRLLGVGAGRARLSIAAGGAGPEPRLHDDESYSLRIDADGASLAAASPWGAAHGLERCLQLVDLDAAGHFLPGVTIEDGPRFPWRGLLLDIVRHFLDLPTLLRTLDGMAAAGLNVLHLHLNDDQAFRVESRRCPQLHERAGAGGVLRREDVATLVAAAAQRGIRVVPELDVPGHAGALLWACPELAAGDPPTALPRAFGPSRHALDPSLDATWALLEALLDDLVELFPDPYFHLGGDEVHPEVYAFGDARRRDWMAEQGITDAAGVQAWFTRRMVGLLEARGRRALGWDEVLHPELPPGLTIQSWRGAATLEAALAAGRDALFSAGYYLDLNYPARLHYAFDPAAGDAALRAAEAGLRLEPSLADVSRGVAALHDAAAESAAVLPPAATRGVLLGGEACLWSELVTGEILDARLYGRLAAVAERLWSPADAADLADFEARLPGWLAHLERVTECRPLSPDPVWFWRFGAAPHEHHHLQTLFEALEPVRWYRRLLGEAGVGDRLAGAAPQRPFDADTPLDRPVDILPPESSAMGQLADSLARLAADPKDDGAALSVNDVAARWHRLPALLAPLLQRSPELQALAPRVAELAELAPLLDALLEALLAGRPADAALCGRFAEISRRAAPAVAETRLAALDPLAVYLGATP